MSCGSRGLESPALGCPGRDCGALEDGWPWWPPGRQTSLGGDFPGPGRGPGLIWDLELPPPEAIRAGMAGAKGCGTRPGHPGLQPLELCPQEGGQDKSCGHSEAVSSGGLDTVPNQPSPENPQANAPTAHPLADPRWPLLKPRSRWQGQLPRGATFSWRGRRRALLSA